MEITGIEDLRKMARTSERISAKRMTDQLPLDQAAQPLLGCWDAAHTKVAQLRAGEGYDQHICLFGEMDKPQNRDFLIMQLFQCAKRNESVVVAERGGAAYSAAGSYFREHRYQVKRINLYDGAAADGIDLFREIRNHSMPRLYTEVLLDVFLHNIEVTPELYSCYRAGRSLLEALFLIVAHDPEYEERRNFTSVLQLIEEGQEQGFWPIIERSGVRGLEELFSVFQEETADMQQRIIKHQLRTFRALQAPGVQAALTAVTMDLELPGQQPCAYFIETASAGNPVWDAFQPVIIQMIIEKLWNSAHEREGMHLACPVNMIFSGAVYLHNFQQMVSELYKRGIHFLMVCPDIDRFQSVYDKAHNILMQFAVKLSIGNASAANAAYLAKIPGVIFTEHGEYPIYPKEELMNKPSGRIFVILQNNVVIEMDGILLEEYMKENRIEGEGRSYRVEENLCEDQIENQY